MMMIRVGRFHFYRALGSHMKQILLGEQLYMYERYKDITKLMLFDAVPYGDICVMEN